MPTKRFVWKDRDTAALDLIQLVHRAPLEISQSALCALQAIRSNAIVPDLEALTLDPERDYWERCYALYALADIPGDIQTPSFAAIVETQLQRRWDAMREMQDNSEGFHQSTFANDFLFAFLGVIDHHPSNRQWFFECLDQANPLVVRDFLTNATSYYMTDEFQRRLVKHLRLLLGQHPDLLNMKSVEAISRFGDQETHPWLSQQLDQIVELCVKEQFKIPWHWEWPELQTGIGQIDPDLVQLEKPTCRSRQKDNRDFRESPVWKILDNLYQRAKSGDKKACYELRVVRGQTHYRTNTHIPVSATAVHFLGKLQRQYPWIVDNLCPLLGYKDTWPIDTDEGCIDPDAPVRFEAAEALRHSGSPKVWEAFVQAFFMQPPNRLTGFLVECLAHLTDVLSGYHNVPEDIGWRIEDRTWFRALPDLDMEKLSMTSLRDLPSIDSLLLACAELQAEYGRDQTVRALRRVVDDVRQGVLAGDSAIPSESALVGRAAALLLQESRPTLRPVVNASGVIIHTNLGRAPLSDAAIEAMRAVGSGYSTLEYELEPGARGKRERHIERILIDVTGAEAAMVVNNNASGVLLALSALARDHEAIISRGQLIEIGGSFRIPDVMAQSGAIMVEVGTTNRTHLRDYANAITEHTAVIMRVHASNYRVIGFTESVPLEALAELAHERGLILLDDIGSGAIIDPAQFGLANEPTVDASLAAGADLVLFSGDKLLGGPQAGIIIGRADLIETLKRHPLARAVRADKLCLAGLSATLDHYRRGEALDTIPVWRMISLTPDVIRERAEAWVTALSGAIGGEIVRAESTVGGGSLPGETLPTWAFAPEVDQPNAAAAILRQFDPPVIARVAHDRLLLDPRTVLPGQDGIVIEALKTLRT